MAEERKCRGGESKQESSKMNPTSTNWKKNNPMYLTRMPFEEFRGLCNGQEAYGDYAPALLSAAVVRERELLDQIEQLKSKK